MVQSPLLLEEEDPSAIDELKSKGKPKSNKLQLFKHSRKLFWKREEFMPALLTLPLISEVDCGKEGHSVPLFTEERNENFFRVPGIQFIGSRRSIVVCNVDERGKRYDGIFLPELNVERQIKAILHQTTPLLYKLLIGSNRQPHLFWINCGPVPFSLRLKVNQS
ncbi:hypothetical protein L1987_88152 [Smallanthus sonchifolius]|nr:hypothetical protein L1987_89861 [Smallanthus sonchifolius]KAI3666501.1 hypothetical protein L1987_88987 [Smallanthus sonchifolius]KAI3668345.1 hypothetical protein L1987_88664 [Smallanthus sonchifolius]KAI3668499.1 hypothetical protein L1987_88501 [Smallanthus sonchifolius]KAI3668826.1 hypothetical protein L1987_88152 [Smallanthus sonchifolius]